MNKASGRRKKSEKMDEEFKKMWLTAEITPKNIADHFSCSRPHVHYERRRLGLPPKGTQGFERTQNVKLKYELDAREILKFLKEQGGYYPRRLLQLKFSESTLTKLRSERRIFVVTFDLGAPNAEKTPFNFQGAL